MNKICTIIANYNYEKYIVECINSALNQTYKNHSVIFVDDGSSDNSWKIVQENFPCSNMTMKTIDDKIVSLFEHKNLTYLRIENSGASVARNTAIKIAGSCDAIHVLDSDDIALPFKVEVMEKVLFEYDEIGVVYADYEIIRPTYSKYEYKEPYSFGRLRESCIVHSGSMIKSKYLKMVSKDGFIYNPELHGPGSREFIGACEDYDLWLRLSNVCMFVHIPEILTIVNEHGKNASTKVTPKIFQENLKIIRNNLKQKS